MKILYLGADSPFCTTYHRAQALVRLGHDVTHINPRKALSAIHPKLLSGISTRFGYKTLSILVIRYLRKVLNTEIFDLAIDDTCAVLGVNAYKFLKTICGTIINYNNDDPFGGRDGRKWDLYRQCIPLHDLTVVVRLENVSEAYAQGAKKVVRVYMSYDPVAHLPVKPTDEERIKWSAEVAFIGSWMPERGPFMSHLIKLGVPLTLRGDRWYKAREWPEIQKIWKGPAVGGRDYVLSIQCAKVALGLLSKGNRDLHTQRSVEVPFIGGAAFCAERTTEHLGMYKEGEEAEFWSTPEECAAKCFSLLENETRRERIVQAAKARVEASGLSNDDVLKKILESV